MSANLTAVVLTLQLATVTTAVLLVLGTPLAWWLSRSRSRGVFLVEALVTLPLVLPPTVIGFYLLLAFSPSSFISQIINSLGGGSLIFSFSGLVVGSVIYSLPFVVQPLTNMFRSIGERPLEVAKSLGARPLDQFVSVVLPLSWPGYLTATVLGFAHTVGEFGIVLMVGGNIPGETRTASIAIYDYMENLDYANAHQLAGSLLLISLLVLALTYKFNQRTKARML